MMVCLGERLLDYYGQRLAAPGHRWTMVGLGAGIASVCYMFRRYSSSKAAADGVGCTPVELTMQRTASNASLLPANTGGPQDVVPGATTGQQALQAVQENSATIIQRAYRKHIELRMRTDPAVQAATVLQALYRGKQARQQYSAMRRQRAAVASQAHWRGAAQRAKFRALRDAATVIQELVRARQAAAQLCHLRASQAAAGGTDRARGAGPEVPHLEESFGAPLSSSLGHKNDEFRSMSEGGSPMCGGAGTSGRVAAAAAATACGGSRLPQESKQHPPPTRREHLSNPTGSGWPALSPGVSGDAAANPDAFGYHQLIAASKDDNVKKVKAADLAGPRDGQRGGRGRRGGRRLRNGSQMKQQQQSGCGAASLTAAALMLSELPMGPAAAANGGKAAAAGSRGWSCEVLTGQGATNPAVSTWNDGGPGAPPGWGHIRRPTAATRLVGFHQSIGEFGAPPGFSQRMRVGSQSGNEPAAAVAPAKRVKPSNSNSHRCNRAPRVASSGARGVLYAAAQRAAASCSSQRGPAGGIV